MMQKFNIYRNDTNKSKGHHVTSGTYNKQQQIDTLLNDINRCKALKQHSFSLDYDWKYDSYC